MKVKVNARPFNVLIGATRFALTSDEAQRIIDQADEVERATSNRVILRDGGQRVIIAPASWGGGPAFEVQR